jgi:type II secretory pathway pseudopilin PulG
MMMRDTKRSNKYNKRMNLADQPASAKTATAGKGKAQIRLQNGYAMAALLVGISVMSVLMSMALPVWSHMMKREREEELIWRGNQYVRAIRLFQMKFANTFPPTIDVLVDQRFLRKKYKDPITNDDFEPVPAGVMAMPQNQVPGQRQPPAPATGGAPPRSTMSTPTQATTPGGNIGLGIGGVRSKSRDASIKIYNGRQKYNEWTFVHVMMAQRVGAPPGGGQQFPGMMQPGQPGLPPGRTPDMFMPPGSGGRGGGMPPMMPGGRPPVPPFGQPPGQPPFGQPSPFGGRGQQPVPQRPPGN